MQGHVPNASEVITFLSRPGTVTRRATKSKVGAAVDSLRRPQFTHMQLDVLDALSTG